MLRVISRLVLVLLAILVIASFHALAVEKLPKSNPASADARKQVEAALRAEGAGDNNRRTELLSSAVNIAPDLPEANWQLGRVKVADKWLTLDNAQQEAARDQQLAEYRKLRDEAGDNPKLLHGLARWCLKKGWEDAARLHYIQLLNHSEIDDEAANEAVKRLGLHNVSGVWLTEEQVKGQAARTRAIDAALKQWRPRLKRLQVAIDGDDYPIRARAIKDVQAIDDPQAIVVIESFQLDGGDRFCEEAAKALGKFPQIEATEALVRFAALSPFAGAREAAIAGLKPRPKHDYVPLLLSGLITPIKTQFSLAPGGHGTVQFIHTMTQETASARIVDVRTQVAQPIVWKPKARHFSMGMPIYSSFDVMLAAVGNAYGAVQAIDLEANAANLRSDASNRTIFDALEQLSDTPVGRDANQWLNWWQDYNQYHWPKPTYCAYQERPSTYFAGIGTSCFMAGTLVHTLTGYAPIESMKPGDRVLSQNQDSGELNYKTVLRTTLRPPTKMVRIYAAGDEITTTLGHPFWVDGHGWKMAKELKEGDLLHSLNGAVRIEKVEPAGEDKAYNLVVDDFNTYFVGQQGLLVHDNEFRKPTRAIVPGLVEERVAVATAPKK